MIENILFDAGVVLLHIDYTVAAREILPLCDPARVPMLNRFLTLNDRDPIVAEYELGRVTTEAFFRHFCARSGYRGTLAQFIAAWHDTLSRNEPMLAFASEMSASYRLYIATNTGEVQIPRIYEFFPKLAYFKDMAASCFLGELKPGRGFYEKALAQFRVTADTCLFIDDRPENVEGARAYGIRSILYTTAAETIVAARQALLT